MAVKVHFSIQFNCFAQQKIVFLDQWPPTPCCSPALGFWDQPWLLPTWSGGFWRWSVSRRCLWSSLGSSGCPALWAGSLPHRSDLGCLGSCTEQRQRVKQQENYYQRSKMLCYVCSHQLFSLKVLSKEQISMRQEEVHKKSHIYLSF